MSKRKIAIANKRRGRAYQAKLAELARGVNIGTLGGEDISHEEFSYEAKTYNIKAKSNKNKPWMGEYYLSYVDGGYARHRFGILLLVSEHFSDLILLRWHWWSKLIETKFKEEFPYMTNLYIQRMTNIKPVVKFIGNTYMNQAEKNCPDGKLPVVSVHTTGRRYEQDIIIIRKIYWDSLIERVFPKEE